MSTPNCPLTDSQYLCWSVRYNMSMITIQTNPLEKQAPARLVSAALLAVLCLFGVLAFLYPFFLTSPAFGTTVTAHAADAPLFFVVLGPTLLVLILAELGAGRLNAKTVAVLGILT